MSAVIDNIKNTKLLEKEAELVLYNMLTQKYENKKSSTKGQLWDKRQVCIIPLTFYR